MREEKEEEDFFAAPNTSFLKCVWYGKAHHYSLVLREFLVFDKSATISKGKNQFKQQQKL